MTIKDRILDTFERQLQIMDKQSKTLDLLCTAVLDLKKELKEVKELVRLQNTMNGTSTIIN